MPTTITIDAGTLTANKAARIVTGLLLPYGEECRSNLGRFSFTAGAVQVPADLAGMSLNVEHARENVIGAPVTVTETPAGIVASFKVADTAEGDRALEDIATGRRRHLSAEVAGVKIKNGKGIAGRLFAAALVAEPAFPSATLLAAAADTDPAGPDTGTEAHTESEFVDENGVKWRRVEDTTTSTEDTAEGTVTTSTTTVIEETTTPAPEPVTNESEEAVTAVPNTLTAAKAGGMAQTTAEARPVDLGAIYASIRAHHAGAATHEQATLLAALTDVKISGSNALPASGVLRENWVGPVWQGKEYVRKYITLGTLGTDISAAGKAGFTIARGTSGSPATSLGGDWAGNKVEVPTGTGHTAKLTSTLARFAFAADIAREFFDLPGGQEVVEAFIRLIVEDYAEWSDNKALAAFIAAAGTPVTPNTYPADYNDSLGAIIQGILAVRRAKGEPTFAIVNETAYEELLYTPKDKIPEFLSFSFGLEGEGTADAGKVTVVEAPDSAFTGLVADTPAVLVGSKRGIEFDELGATPIQVDALEIAKGGVDRAIHGYLQTFPVNTAAFQLVGTVTP